MNHEMLNTVLLISIVLLAIIASVKKSVLINNEIRFPTITIYDKPMEGIELEEDDI